MREHLARHYYPRYCGDVTYHELREAGQGAIDAILLAAHAAGDPHTLPTRLYRQIKTAIVHCGTLHHQHGGGTHGRT